MNSREWKRLVQPMLPQDSSCGFMQRLCYRRPVGWVLCGVLAEGSAYAEAGAFYLWDVQLPLFGPRQVLDLTFSERVGGGSKTYSVDEPDELRAALSEVLARDMPSDDEIAMRLAGGPLGNLLWAETAAYAVAHCGDAEQAQTLLTPVREYPAKYDWEREMVSRASAVAEMLDREDREAVRDALGRWRAQTLDALGIQQ